MRAGHAQNPSEDYNSTLSLAVCVSMIIGNTHLLPITSIEPEQIWVQHPQIGEIPLPYDDAPDSTVGGELDVFIYTNSEGKPVGTTKQPFAKLGECACLKVSSITDAGAFLQWGIAKELLLPFAEQRRPLEAGSKESILVYLDNSNRLAATSRLDHHLPDTDDHFSAWQQVSLLVYQRTELGFKAVVDNRAIGLLYKNEIFQTIKVGQQVTGFVKRLRQDHKLDLALQPPAQDVKATLSEIILEHMTNHNGECLLTDKSAPQDIYETFQVSKKNYKRAISSLYKQRMIVIEPHRIVLAKDEI